MAHQSDLYWLSLAAEQSLIPETVKRNPRVGAIVVDNSGLVVSKGFHDGYGTAHAEQVALEKAKGKAKGSTIFISLAPCNHVGKTPSCCELIISKGVRRVVYSNSDPNPLSVGNIEFLKANGVEVSHVKSPKQYENINYRWLKSYELGRPFVTAKIAMSLDSKIDNQGTKRMKLTGEEVQKEVHKIRNGCDAIITGTSTVLADNPKLNVRIPRKLKNSSQPIRLIVGDTSIPSEFSIHDNSALTIFSKKKTPRLYLEELSDLDARTVLLETGSTLLADFLNHDLVDEFVIYIAPIFLGRGKAVVEEILHPISSREFKVSSVGLVGEDIRFRVSLR